MDNRFERTCGLLGASAVERLRRARVAVFGIGGVGSYTAEALARSAVGGLDLFDSDRVDITNINRQIMALTDTVGQYKTECMRQRILQINPEAQVTSNIVFITPEIAAKIDFSVYDYVVDAVDNVTAKLSICAGARAQGVPVLSVMGAGNKLDPTQFTVVPVEKTHTCPLARVMRIELKKRGIHGVLALFSSETPVVPAGMDGITDGRRRSVPASVAFVPSVAGLIAAGAVIRELAGL